MGYKPWMASAGLVLAGATLVGCTSAPEPIPANAGAPKNWNTQGNLSYNGAAPGGQFGNANMNASLNANNTNLSAGANMRAMNGTQSANAGIMANTQGLQQQSPWSQNGPAGGVQQAAWNPNGQNGGVQQAGWNPNAQNGGIQQAGLNTNAQNGPTGGIQRMEPERMDGRQQPMRSVAIPTSAGVPYMQPGQNSPAPVWPVANDGSAAPSNTASGAVTRDTDRSTRYPSPAFSGSRDAGQ